jgi:CPA2 family monovalent cation:H+ antiporter-2
VVDYDLSVLSALRDESVRVIYGDATSQTVLESAKPECVELIVVALPEADMTLMAIRLLREMAPDVPVIARVHRGKDIPRIRQAGADAVIHAEFEAGTEMIRQTLDRLGFPDPEVDEYILNVRLLRYRVEPD